MVKNIIILSIIFLTLDSCYLSLMKNKFNEIVKNIQGSDLKLNLLSTFLCYVFLISSIYYFLICKESNLLDAFLLGFFIYGVFDTTNLAIFKEWDYTMALIDTLWGGLLFMSTFYIYNKFLKSSSIF